MTLYLDSSAFLKLYVEEGESPHCRELVAADPRWTTARHTVVEVRRNLARLLRGSDHTRMRRRFEGAWRQTVVLELDRGTCSEAAAIAERTLVRALDALHVAAARRLDDPRLSFLTFDRRQAEAARGLGLSVVGV